MTNRLPTLQLPTLLICQATRRHVTVALSGDGETSCSVGMRSISLPTAWPPRWPGRAFCIGLLVCWRDQARISPFVASPTRPVGASLFCCSSDRRREYETLSRAATSVSRTASTHGLRERMDQVPRHGLPFVMTFSLAMVYDALTYLPDDILVKVDRAAMAFSKPGAVSGSSHRGVRHGTPDGIQIAVGSVNSYREMHWAS